MKKKQCGIKQSFATNMTQTAIKLVQCIKAQQVGL